jgi:hypothetical protein
MSIPYADEMELSAEEALAHYDILLSDIKPSDLPAAISMSLGCEYLSTCKDVQVWPVRGKIYGRHKRSIITLPVSWGSHCVNVHFLFDTGAPHTAVAGSVLSALGMEDWQLSDKRPKVNGIMLDLTSSEGQYWDSEVEKWRNYYTLRCTVC